MARICVDVVFFGGADHSTLADIVRQTLDKESIKGNESVRVGSQELVLITAPDTQTTNKLAALLKLAPQVKVKKSVAAQT